MSKTIYLIDPESGLLLGESLHPLDPVETERTGKPVYALLNLSMATTAAPPRIPAGMQARMVRGTWSLEAIPAAAQPAQPAEASQQTAPAPRTPTFDERATILRGHVQEYMEAMARSLGYDDIKTAVTYADEPSVPKFQNEGRALRAWRSLVWAACYELLERVKAGAMKEPSEKTLIGLLPSLVIPPLETAPEASTQASTQALTQAPTEPAEAQASSTNDRPAAQ